MSILASVITRRQPKPPRMILYGPGGIGKTTLVASIPGVLILQAEDGADTMDVPRLPMAKTWPEVKAQVQALWEEPHSYSTLAVDSLSSIEALIWQHVAQTHNASSIAEIPYGKGYDIALEEWFWLMGACNYLRDQRGMASVLTAHSTVVRYDNPATDSYDRIQPQMHKKAVEPLYKWADAVLYAGFRVYVQSKDLGFNKERTRAVGTGERVLHTSEMPAFLAKNRYSLPAELPLAWDPLMAGIAAAFAAGTVAPELTNPPAQPATTAAAPAAA